RERDEAAFPELAEPAGRRLAGSDGAREHRPPPPPLECPRQRGFGRHDPGDAVPPPGARRRPVVGGTALAALAHEAGPRRSRSSSARYTASSSARSTRSSAVCASSGSPGPKLSAGTPRAAKRATSVHPNLAVGVKPPRATSEASSGWSRP